MFWRFFSKKIAIYYFHKCGAKIGINFDIANISVNIFKKK